MGCVLGLEFQFVGRSVLSFPLLQQRDFMRDGSWRTLAVPDRPHLIGRHLDDAGALARGRQNKEIVAELGISPSTVATHIRRIYEKLHVHSRAEAVGKFATLVRR
jgi:DNA-binding CsgD family transcriptional regulator